MTKYARLTDADLNGDRVVIEVVEAGSAGELVDRYHPDLAGQFIQVPSATVPGSVKNGSSWTHPEPAEPPAAPGATYLKQISPVAFLLQFMSEERVAIRLLRAKASDPEDPAYMAALVVDDWMRIVEDPRLTIVDLALATTQGGLDFLASINILTTERAAEIKLGIPQ